MPDELLTRMIKSDVPVNAILETVTVFPEKVKAIGDPFCVTVMFCLSEIFSMVAVTDAIQFSVVTGEDDGAVIVTTGAGITGHAPCVSPCAWCAGHADSAMVIA